MNVSPGDYVLVDARGEMKVVQIHEVDDEVKIEPNADTAFKWVVCKIDMDGYRANEARNAQIERTVSEAYRDNLKKSFAQSILGGLSAAKAKEVKLLLGKK